MDEPLDHTDDQASVETPKAPLSPDHDEPQITLTVHHRNQPTELTFPASATLFDLSARVATTLSVPAANQKFLVSPNVGLLKPPPSPTHPSNRPLAPLAAAPAKKIVLLGATASQVATLNATIARGAAPLQRRAGVGGSSGVVKAARATRTAPSAARAMDDATYTFGTTRALSGFADAARATALLERLRADAGVHAAMRRWHFRVGVLAEMDPAAHTTHHSRTLGLNRNQGEAIELRLRTDAYDGFRDYRGIRRVLCHELAHNVWGDHDRNFWDLCRQIERVVETEDWRSGGRSVGGGEYYQPPAEEEHVDGGGWTGGEYVIGGRAGHNEGLSRREILARAVEERIKKLHEAENGGSGEDGADGKGATSQ